jgi:hypothetical protein
VLAIASMEFIIRLRRTCCNWTGSPKIEGKASSSRSGP